MRRTLLAAAVLLPVLALVACSDDDDASPSAVEPATVRVMQFNVEYGGTLVDFDSVPAAVEAANADVVALQEAYGNTCKVADAVGWDYCDPRTQTISRFPLVTQDERAPEVLVAVEPGAVFGVVNVHLPSAPYGPNRAAAGATEAELIAGEKGRLKAIAPALDAADRLRVEGVPVVLIGDFNTPSHLDWTIDTEGSRDHVSAVAWPVTMAVGDAGLVDAYRAVHPDPAADQGLTWPASRPKAGSYNPGPAGKPADRIDLTFVSDEIVVTASEIVGEAESADTDIAIDPWPGDHRAVVSTLEVPLAESGPYVAPAQRLVERGEGALLNAFASQKPTSVTAQGQDGVEVTAEADASGGVTMDTSELSAGAVALVATGDDGSEVASGQLWVSEAGADPQISVDPSAYGRGDPIDVAWSGAPGNKWDWLGVYKRGADPNIAYYKLWAYTEAAIVGEATVDGGFNGRAWPLPPGEYDVVLLKDDSYEELARAPFTIKP